MDSNTKLETKQNMMFVWSVIIIPFHGKNI